MIFKVWSGLFLLVCAMIDLKTKKVYQSICILNYIMVIAVKLILEQLEFISLVHGLVLCAVLLVISILTKEAIGRGDIWVIFVLTGLLKVKDVFEILFLALCVCCVFSLFMLLMKKINMKHALPFVPFLLIGDCLWMILGGAYAS